MGGPAAGAGSSVGGRREDALPDSVSDGRPAVVRSGGNSASPARPRAPVRRQAVTCCRNRTIEANSTGSMLAPPTRAPSMSGSAMILATFEALTEPP